MLLLALATSIARAESPAAEAPTVKVSGVVFPSWQMALTDGAENANAFSVDRVYLRTDATMSPHFGARITLDADRMKPAELASGEAVTYDTKYRVFVKHAYLEVKDLGDIKIRAGMVDTPYAPYYDALWGKRYIAESFAKRVGVLDTADLGVAVLGKHGKGLVDWNLSVLNGEGYGKVEVDAGKAVQARVTVDPLAGKDKQALPITGFASYNPHPIEETATQTWAVAAGYDIHRLFAWLELLGSTTGETSGMGWSASLNPRLPAYAGLVLRYDEWDPDTSAAGDAQRALIAGVDKNFMEKVSLALTYERSWTEGTESLPVHGIALHAQAGF